MFYYLRGLTAIFPMGDYTVLDETENLITLESFPFGERVVSTYQKDSLFNSFDDAKMALIKGLEQRKNMWKDSPQSAKTYNLVKKAKDPSKTINRIIENLDYEIGCLRNLQESECNGRYFRD